MTKSDLDIGQAAARACVDRVFDAHSAGFLKAKVTDQDCRQAAFEIITAVDDHRAALVAPKGPTL